jgi:hypothetical protein
MLLTTMHLVILELVRSEKKRKMVDVVESVTHVLLYWFYER